jgi:hypothetical protein
MTSENNGRSVGRSHLLSACMCEIIIFLVLEGNGDDVRESQLWCQRVTVIVSASR